MSTAYGRLCMARDNAHPITTDQTVEVLASDLDAVLAFLEDPAGEQAKIEKRGKSIVRTEKRRE